MFRIVIADSDERRTLRLAGAISCVEGLRVVGTVHDGGAVLDLVHRAEPDVVLIDIDLEPLGGLAPIGTIKRLGPGTRVVVVAVDGQELSVERALTSGADGLVTTEGPADQATATLVWFLPEKEPDDGLPPSDASLCASYAGRPRAGREPDGQVLRLARRVSPPTGPSCLSPRGWA